MRFTTKLWGPATFTTTGAEIVSPVDSVTPVTRLSVWLIAVTSVLKTNSPPTLSHARWRLCVES